MQLAIILALLATILISESAPAEPVGESITRAVLAICCMTSVVAFALLGSLLIAPAADNDTVDLDVRRRIARFHRFHLALWFTATLAVIYGLQWPQLVRFTWQLDGTFLIDELLIILPVVLPLLGSWAMMYHVNQAPSKHGRARFVLLHARHHLGLIMVPVLIVFAVGDLIRIIGPLSGGQKFSGFVYTVALAALLVFLPVVLKTVWRTEPLPLGPLRDRLVRASRRAGLVCRDLLIWKSDNQIVNAAVAGIFPRWRYVFLSDELLNQFSDEEIEVVFLHEAAHVRRWHLMWRSSVLCLPIVLWIVVQWLFPGIIWTITEMALSLGINPRMQVSVLMPAGMAVYALAALGLTSHILEHDADLWACRRLHDHSKDGSLRSDATGRFVRVLKKLGHLSGCEGKRATWLHPTIASRVKFVQMKAGMLSPR